MKLLMPPINVCPMRGRDEMKNERLFPLSTLYPVLALIMEAASSKGAMTACGSRLMFCRFTTASHTTNARGTRKHKMASAVMTVAAMVRFIFRFSDR